MRDQKNHPKKQITKKQEAHGPHRSPEKTVQINNTYDYIITLIKRRKKTLLTS